MKNTRETMDAKRALRILFVEDLPSDEELAKREIRKSGLKFDSQRVDTKDAFLRALEEFRPDVIVSDYMMPEFDGMQALKLSMEQDPRRPFILLTGSMNEETAVACMKAGATDYVIKEHIARLPFAVREAVEQKKMRAAKDEAERALRESEEKFRRVVETALEGVWFLDREFKTTEVNDAVVRMLGYSPEELIGRPFVDLLLGEDRSTQVQEFQRRGSGLSGQYERRLLCKGGGVKWLFISAKAVMNTAGAFVGSFAMVTDITERKRAEEKIVLLAHTVESISECVCMTDLDDTILFVNQAFLTTYGYDEQELLGKNIKIVRSPNNPPEIVRGINTATLGGGWHGELMNRTKDGREFQVSFSTSFVRDNSGKPIALVGVTTDITERKHVEERLRASETYYRTLTEASPDALIITDMNGALAFASPKAFDMFGVPPEQMIIGTSILNWISPDDHGLVKALLQALASDGSAPSQREIRLLKHDRTLFWGEINSSSISDEGGGTIGLLIACRDISDRKRAEEALRENEQRTRTFLDSTSDMAFLKDESLRHIIANRALCKFYGKTESEIIGKTDFDLMPENAATGCRKTDEQTLRSNALVISEEVVQGRYYESMRFPVELAEGRKGVGGYIRDITEHKLAEEASNKAAEALRQSEARYRAVLQSANDAIVTADSNGSISGWNKGAERMFGYTYVEAVGISLTRLIPQSFRADHAQGLETLKAGRYPFMVGKAIEVKGARKDGTEFPLELTLATWEVSERHFHTAIIRDITERKRAEETRLLQTTALESTVNGVVITDLNGTIAWVNKAFTKMTGYSLEEAVGQNPRILKSGKQDEAFYSSLWGTIGTGNVWKGEVVNKRKDGSFYTEEMTITPVRDRDGNVSHFVALKQDITERKRAEAAVRESELRFRSVWDNSADGMRLTDREGHILDANHAFCRLVEIPREELLGQVLSIAYQREGPDDDLSLYQKRFDASETISSLLGAATLRNGQTVQLEVTSSFIEITGQKKMLLSLFRDVTERKQVEKRMQEERNLLRTIIDAIPDEISVKDTERRFIVVNSGTVNALKRASADEIIGKRDEDFIPEHLTKDVRWEENAVLAVGGHTQNRVADKVDPETGEIERSLLISKIPLKDNEGRIIGLVGINRDITELKRVEEMLQKERTLLQTLIESIPDEVCLKDLKHRYVVANRASIEAFGATSLEAMIGKTDQDFVPPSIVQRHFAEEEAIVASGEPVINREQTKLNPDTGEIDKCVLTTRVPVRDQTGKMIGILVVNRNITDRKRAEEGLRASEEKFRSLFEESKDCIYISSADGKLLDINAAGVEMFGYGSKEELLCIDPGSDLYVDSQQRVELFSRLNRQGFVKDFEATMKRKDGQKLSVLETATAVRDKQGKVVMHRGTIRDVTRQKLLERQVGQAQKMESLGLLAGGIAHDFNNILGIILGHTAIVERAGGDPALLNSSSEEITKAVQRGASLVRQILTFARKSDPTLEPVNVNATIRELSKMINDTFPKTITVALDLEKPIPIVMMDQTQLHQALLNLCVNARDAITDTSTGNLGRGEIKIKTQAVEGGEVRKEFYEASAKEYVCISVSDSGIGMDDVTKEHIFEPFFTTKEQGKGTGLGLSVVYGVIKTHHGHVDVESEVGKGTTFKMYLPVPDEVASPAAQVEVGSVGSYGGHETILLVEDEENLLSLMKLSLERQGYKVLTATDGIAAIKVFSLNKQKIALVLTDIGLPKLDGAAVVTSLMEIDPNVKIILASGYLEPNMKSNLLRSGAKDFIQKPYSPGVVLKTIREVLDSEK